MINTLLDFSGVSVISITHYFGTLRFYKYAECVYNQKKSFTRSVGKVPNMSKEGAMLILSHFFLENSCNRGLNDKKKCVVKVFADPIKKSYSQKFVL